MKDSEAIDLNIRQFKLMNGEEIVGLVHGKDETKIAIERPCRVHQNVLGGFQLLPWFSFSSQRMFTIEKRHIIYHVEIDNDVKGAYIKASTLATEPVKPSEIKTDEDMLAEYEEYLEDVIEDRSRSKKVVH